MEKILQTAIAFKSRLLGLSEETRRGILFSFSFFFVIVLFCFLNQGNVELERERFLFSGAVLSLYFIHRQSRIFIIITLPMLFQAMIFDSFRYVPFSWYLPIRIAEPYHLDQMLFGINLNSQILLLNEYFLTFAHPALDFISGLLYHALDPMTYILLIVFWRFKSADLAQRYSSAFLLMNFFAFATYLFYPAAAPWYVAKYGFLQPLAPVFGDAAGLAKFDQLIGSGFSNQLYQSSPVVFGAIPSMHAGFTMLGLIYSFHLSRKMVLPLALYTVGMWCSALYLQHHYMIDVVIGVLYAIIAYLVIEKLLLKMVRRTYGHLFKYLIDAGIRPIFGHKPLK